MKAASRNFNLRNVLVRIENLACAFEFKKNMPSLAGTQASGQNRLRVAGG